MQAITWIIELLGRYNLKLPKGLTAEFYGCQSVDRLRAGGEGGLPSFNHYCKNQNVSADKNNTGTWEDEIMRVTHM